ncbi:Negative regulator of sexual conjugation and meiosis [Hypsizygus marmoreus]|uniref:Negative regulator of sexual conjugation and meiosis n=1 Tax=Hypsizygus marmoreus TaxID=39966 RepID=A0A369KB40_HYPMA|nr:Negative regulator of sexual conjugation and meiosis [Hypsizygus marmoreus]
MFSRPHIRRDIYCHGISRCCRRIRACPAPSSMSHKTSAAVSSDSHPPVGTLIDGDSLELVEVLGVGGYGVVYRAVDVRSPSPKSYAVKCLVSQAHQTARQRQIHIREIALHQIASSHPGVVTLHRVVEDYSRTYIIMDYAPDHDLFTQILHSCRYLGDDALIKHVFLQLLDAVEYCHSLGIYHRDLKPENILCFDDGLRVAITDFGLATTDKVSEEFRTGSVFHMSPECQGGEFAPTGNYSPMFNDIWSLGIILLNLATGRNPWKSATPDDQTFCAYLRDPLNFLPTVLPISPEVNDILTRMLEVDWRERMTLRELRHAIEEVETFYSDGVIFEGSMARCPWESGMDIDSDSSEDTKESTPPPKSAGEEFTSHWSKDSTSEIVFARLSAGSVAEDSSYGAPWTEFSSCGATWAYESPSSSISRRDRSSTPLSPVSAGTSSLPVTPNSIDMLFGSKVTATPRKGLTIDTNFAQPRFYNQTTSMATSRSTGTSMMQTAVEYDPYASSFFFASAASESKVSMAHPVSITASFNDKEMTSPSIWNFSATGMSSPSAYSSSGSSVDSGEMAFTRSETPSPNTAWSEYRTQVQCLPHSQPSQPSPSVYAIMTDVIPPSRPSLSIFASKKSHDGSKRKASSIFNPIKFFPRSPPSTPPPSPPNPPQPYRRDRDAESRAATQSNQEALAAPFAAPWAHVPTPQGSLQHTTHEVQHTPQDQRPSHFRSPRHWFMSGKFFAYAGAQ